MLPAADEYALDMDDRCECELMTGVDTPGGLPPDCGLDELVDAPGDPPLLPLLLFPPAADKLSELGRE